MSKPREHQTNENIAWLLLDQVIIFAPPYSIELTDIEFLTLRSLVIHICSVHLSHRNVVRKHFFGSLRHLFWFVRKESNDTRNFFVFPSRAVSPLTFLHAQKRQVQTPSACSLFCLSLFMCTPPSVTRIFDQHKFSCLSIRLQAI